jgi:hypothetical protein
MHSAKVASQYESLARLCGSVKAGNSAGMGHVQVASTELGIEAAAALEPNGQRFSRWQNSARPASMSHT